MQINIKRSHIKTLANFVVAAGTWKVTSTALKNNLNDPESRSEQLYYSVGTVAIASVVADATQDHTDKLVDKIFDGIDEIKTSKPTS